MVDIILQFPMVTVHHILFEVSPQDEKPHVAPEVWVQTGDKRPTAALRAMCLLHPVA